MPVPSSIADLSKIAADNSPQGTEAARGTIDDYFRAHASFIRQVADLAGGPTVILPSAATVNIGFAASANILITGTTTITAFDVIAEGTLRWVVFAGALTLVHNGASFYLPGGASIATAAGDVALFKSLGGGNWKCMLYERVGLRYPATGTLLSDATAVTIAQGGTGAVTAAAARTALGVPANADVIKKNQPNNTQATRFISTLAPHIAAIASTGQSENVPLIISNGGVNNASAVIEFIRDGQYALYFGLDTDNKLKVGGYSMGEYAYEIYHTGNLNLAPYAALAGATFTGNISAPVVTQTSDERKKKLWQRLPHDFVAQLAGLKKSGLFTWRKGCGAGVGVGAQSLERILPTAVHTDEAGAKTVNYGAAAMVSAVELARMLVAHEKRLAALEAK